MAAASSDKQRAGRVDALVESRCALIRRLKRTLDGKDHWLGVVRLASDAPSLAAMLSSVDAGTSDEGFRWYSLGVSLGPLLELPSGAAFVRAVLQLWEEFEYHFASPTAQSMKAFSARVLGPTAQAASALATLAVGDAGTDDGGGPVDDLSPRPDAEGLRPSLRTTSSGGVRYEVLNVPRLALRVHATSALLALCEVMGHYYRKVLVTSPQGCSKALYDAVVRADNLATAHVLRPAVALVNSIARVVVCARLGAVEAEVFGPSSAFARVLGAHTSSHAADPEGS